MMFDWNDTLEAGGINPNQALIQLDREIAERKTRYYDDYRLDENVDIRHRDNYFESMHKARAKALDVLPTFSTVDLWISEVLPKDPYNIPGKTNVPSTTKNKHENHDQDPKYFEESLDYTKEDIYKQVTQKKNGNVTTRWSKSGSFTTVKAGADWASDRGSVEQFMHDVTAWASKLPEDTDEVVGEAMVKYAELLVSHPDKSNAYYMKAIKNNQTDRGRKRKVEEVQMNYTDEGELVEKKGREDNYAFEVVDWFGGLSKYGQSAIQDSFTFIMENPDKKLPERLKQRVRKIDSRPEFK